MKKFFLMTLVASIAMIFASCGKQIDLTATTWHADESITQQVVGNGISGEVTINVDCILAFEDASTGTMTTKFSGSVTAMGQTQNVPEGNSVDSFTYTFDGENGVLISTDPNETETLPFTYNKKDKVLVINFSNKDEETGMELNFPLHFKRQ